jgi:hypothetical protein
VRNLPCAEPTNEGGLQDCDARTHHPSWSSIILKKYFSDHKMLFFFFDASVSSFIDQFSRISLNMFVPERLSVDHTVFVAFAFLYDYP